MPARYSRAPSAGVDRPDIYLPDPLRRRKNRLRRGAVLIKYVGGYMLAVAVLAAILFLPVLFVEVSRIDAVELSGEILPVSVFASRLGDMFLGTLIVAFALVSFVASAALSAGSLEARSHQTPFSEDKTKPTYKAEGSAVPPVEMLRV
jgi:hypothetical protein